MTKAQPQEADSLVTVGGKRPKQKKMTPAQRQKRRRTQKMVVGGFLLIVIILAWFGMQPLKGNMDYGVCKTFAELHSNSLSPIRVVSYENYGDVWKVFYSYIGQYGEQKSNFIDCTFATDPAGNRVLREAKINRTEISKAQLKRFNMSIPGIIAAGPDLVIPPPLEESDLQGLRNQDVTE